MLKKSAKFVFAGFVVFGTTSLLFPQKISPIKKVFNVGLAGSKMFWVYKHSSKNIKQKNIEASSYLRDALRKNGGLYLKLGQLIATLDVIVPDEYRIIMGTLTRDCPTSNFQKVKLTVQEELGVKLKSFFSQFQQKPISSASIGQVHRARLKSGQEVAVKVQHRQLDKYMNYDLKLMGLFVKIANHLFQNFRYNWLLQQFQKNIKIELDFVHQAQNIRRLDKFIKQQKYKSISVPKVYNPTTKKVLIMEFIHGVHIDQIDKMKQLGVNPKQIGRLFAKLVINMIHKKGFVHGDPHGGNLKVRLGKNNVSELIILDHGLYQQLSNQVRAQYNKFWLGLILNDQNIFSPAAKFLGASNPKLLCSMLTSKSHEQLIDSKRNLFDLNPSGDRQAILKNAEQWQDEIVDTLGQLRRQILLLLKVNQFARSIQNMMGGRQFGVYQDIAYACLQNSQYSWYQKLYYKLRMLRAKIGV